MGPRGLMAIYLRNNVNYLTIFWLAAKIAIFAFWRCRDISQCLEGSSHAGWPGAPRSPSFSQNGTGQKTGSVGARIGPGILGWCGCLTVHLRCDLLAWMKLTVKRSTSRCQEEVFGPPAGGDPEWLPVSCQNASQQV